MAAKKEKLDSWKQTGIKDPRIKKKIIENLKKIPSYSSFHKDLKKSSDKNTNYRVEITYKLNLSNPKLNKEKFVEDVKFQETIDLLSAMHSKNPEEDYKIIDQIIRTDTIIMKFAEKFNGILKEDGEGNVIYGGRDLAFIFNKKDMALNFLREMHSHQKEISKEKIKILALGFYGMDKKNKNYDRKIVYTWLYKNNKWIRRNISI